MLLILDYAARFQIRSVPVTFVQVGNSNTGFAISVKKLASANIYGDVSYVSAVGTATA
ncbi:hypothetical protein D3C86_1997640 [compost metagenome]